MNRSSISVTSALALGALALAAIAVASPVLASPRSNNVTRVPAADPSGNPSTPSISVQGEGRVTLVPDLVTVVVGVDVHASTAAAAQAGAAEKMTAVITNVKSHGIADKDIATVSIALGPNYDYSNNTPKLIDYVASQSLQVKIHKLGDAGKIIDDAVGAGATTVQGISLSVDDPTAAAAQARKLAVADAKARAQALADAAGVGLGDVISIVETSAPSPVPVAFAGGAAPALDKATSQVVAGTLDVTIDVQVSFAID